MPVRELGVLLLQMPRVSQEDRAEVDRGTRAVDGTSEAALDQQRQIAGVVEMGVGENNGVDTARFDRERRPILEAQRLEALKQTAVDEDLMVLMLD